MPRLRTTTAATSKSSMWLTWEKTTRIQKSMTVGVSMKCLLQRAVYSSASFSYASHRVCPDSIFWHSSTEFWRLRRLLYELDAPFTLPPFMLGLACAAFLSPLCGLALFCCTMTSPSSNYGMFSLIDGRKFSAYHCWYPSLSMVTSNS